MSFWNPLTCITGCLVVYSVGEFLSKKTKGAVSSLLFACVLFLIGFWSGLLPKDITTQSGLVAVMANFGTAFMITNIGTLINLEDLIREWKTVVISLFAIAAIALICFTVGSLLFGREYALIAAPPVAGSTVAGIIVTSAAEAANRPELAAFAVLVLSVQKFFGIPISTFCIRKELRIKRGSGFFKSNTVEEKSSLKLPSMRIFKETPKNLRSNTIYICKVALVACIADFVGKATLIPGSSPANYILNPNIAYLLFGLIFARKGYLCKSKLFRYHHLRSAADAARKPCNPFTFRTSVNDCAGIRYPFNLLHRHHCYLRYCGQGAGMLSLHIGSGWRNLYAGLSGHPDYHHGRR